MAIITSSDVINRFRSDVDDPLRGPSTSSDDDCLWSNGEVNAYLADAVERVASETLQLFKTFTTGVAANQPIVKLPSAFTVQDIEHVLLVNERRYLEPRNTDGGFGHHGDYASPWVLYATKWEFQVGTPVYYVRDMQANALRLVPIPTVADTLTITASVIPTYTCGAPLPFSTLRDQHLVLLWMKKLAYSKHDADTYDPQRADRCQSEFDALATKRKYEAQRVNRAVQPVRFSW